MIPFAHHPALDAEIGQRVVREQTRQLYRGGVSASIGVMVGVSLLAWILRPYIPFSVLAGWFFGMLGLMIVRLGLIGVYSRRHPNLGTFARILSPDAALLVVVGSGPTASSRLASDEMARTPESDVWVAAAIPMT